MNWVINALVLGFLAMGGVYSYHMFSSERAMEDGTMFDRGVDPWAGQVEVDNIRAENGYLKDGYVLMARHDQLDTSRIADIALYASARDLLKKGEPAPDASVLPVLVAAAASDMANAECALLLQTVARECAVNKTDTPVAVDGTDYYQIAFEVAFAEKAALVAFDMSKKWTFDDTNHVKLTKKNATGLKVEPSDQRYTRKQFYKELAEGCAESRRSKEPCSLYNINVYAQMEPKTQKVWMDASGDFASLSRLR